MDGSFLATATFPEGEWIFGYIMSYGDYAEVIEPDNIRKTIEKKFEEGYLKWQ